MNFDITRIDSESLIEVPILSLRSYIGVPVLIATPNITYAYRGENKVLSFESEPTYEWIIFDGNVRITPETKHQRYFTFSSIKTK